MQPGTPMTCHLSTLAVLGQDPAGGSSWGLAPQYQTLALALGEGERTWPLLITSFPAAGAGAPTSAAPPPRGCPASYFLPGVNCFGKRFANCIRRVCWQSRAALINLVCEAVSSALVNVCYYLPESPLQNLNKSRGKRKCPMKGNAL